MAEMVGRLRLLRGSHKAPQLVLSEDPRLLQQLRALVDVKPLPCFCVANELTLSFETDAASLEPKDNSLALATLAALGAGDAQSFPLPSTPS